MGQSVSRIAGALEQLEEERAVLAARIEKLDALIAEMRVMVHLPGPAGRMSAPRRVKADRRAPASNGRSRDRDAGEAITAALKAGPLAPGALASQLGIERVTLRRQIRQLEEQGLVVCTGTTAARKVALAGARPAKEVP